MIATVDRDELIKNLKLDPQSGHPIPRQLMLSETEFRVDQNIDQSQSYDLFPGFDYHHGLFPDRNNYGLSTNLTGFQQRAFLMFWAMQIGTRGGISIELGSAGVHMPWTIASDIIRSGKTNPAYGGGTYNGVQLECDASNLDLLGNESFDGVLGNHLPEHLPCKYLSGDVTKISPQYKRSIHCDGSDVRETIRANWIRILRPRGIIAVIIPDAKYQDIFEIDKSHTHSWSGESFRLQIADPLSDVMETLELDSLANNFSFQWVARKK